MTAALCGHVPPRWRCETTTPTLWRTHPQAGVITTKPAAMVARRLPKPMPQHMHAHAPAEAHSGDGSAHCAAPQCKTCRACLGVAGLGGVRIHSNLFCPCLVRTGESYAW